MYIYFPIKTVKGNWVWMTEPYKCKTTLVYPFFLYMASRFPYSTLCHRRNDAGCPWPN